ncbi:ATP-binding protein [Melioribacter sp. Ez-97]|uniref:sensor histidine kinase n=1 Tax=Melioribacter sp. Ez-97 TaxID=3423434 RepID=UPI003EDB63D4
MKGIFKNSDPKWISLIILLLLLIVSAFAAPVLIDRKMWSVRLEEKLKETEILVANAIDKKISRLASVNEKIKTKIPRLSNDDSFTENYFVFIYKEDSLIYWNKKADIEKPENGSAGKPYFFDEGLRIYLVYADTVVYNNNRYFIQTAEIFEQKYDLYGEESRISFSDSLSIEAGTNIKIDYKNADVSIKDGRYRSFIYKSNEGKSLCAVIIENPSLDNEINNLKRTISTVQSLLIILSFFAAALILYGYVGSSSRIAKFAFWTLVIGGGRVIVYLLGIPSSYFHNALTDPSNFSSPFAFGLVRSPAEFLITAISGAAIIIIGYKYFEEYNRTRTDVPKSRLSFPAALLVFTALFLLTLRGVGASIRSVVFDSSIRYFREFNLIPEPHILVMNLNILTLGFSAVLFSYMLLMWLYRFLPQDLKINYFKSLSGLFLLLQTAGFLFDYFQNNPQGTPQIRVSYIFLFVLAGYPVLKKNPGLPARFMLYSLLASVLVVNLLTYYNSELERESLKTTSLELTRNDENIYSFMVMQTLTQLTKDEELINEFGQKADAKAFLAWNRSLLYNENVQSYIRFYYPDGNPAGGYLTDKNLESVLPGAAIQTDSLKLIQSPGIFGESGIIRGVVPLIKNGVRFGYAEAGVIYNRVNLDFASMPVFILKKRTLISDVIDPNRLAVFYLNGDIFKSSSDKINFDGDFINSLKEKFDINHKEEWAVTTVDGEEYLFYITGISGMIVGVGKEEKNISWKLSDFFKVFFIHVFIIFIMILIFSVLNYKKTVRLFESYKARLTAGFLVVSVVPLLITSVYIKDLVETKNDELIKKRLEEYSEQIKNYAKNYQGLIKSEVLFDKAALDLSIDFTVFKKYKYFYSTQPYYYTSGLIPGPVNYKAYSEIERKNKNVIFISEEFEGIPYSSLYAKIATDSGDYIIELNNFFNEIKLPLSDIELDVFMFGILSLSSILLVLLSTLLANQISQPIIKLTNATKSLSGGDLSIKIEGKYSGEIGELTKGFNMMVRRLKENQEELAMMERESAWKEMARQVAHEIKNPLTPIKLSVQQLIAAYRDKSPKFDVIFDKVTNTVINQIELLTNIASEFSNFARMPKLNITKIDLAKIIESVIDLFQSEKIDIKFNKPSGQIIVEGDEQHFTRTFVNLFRNSVQANAKNILVEIKEEDDNYEITVKDDGEGINEEFIDKIFEEKFTTKKQGMGLGLKLSRRFIESIGGKIELAETSKLGTVFKIKLPKANP